MDVSRYADLFLTESKEHLSAMNALLLALEREPSAAEPVAGLFRAVHTVKGMSATMGYGAVTALAHEMESLLDRVRQRQKKVTPELVDLFFKGADALERAIARAAAGGGDDAAATRMATLFRAKAGDKSRAVRAKKSAGAAKKANGKDGIVVRVRLKEG